MKKILFVLFTIALCFPFISCSNDDAMDENVQTRSEVIESQYQEALEFFASLFKKNGYNVENNYVNDLLIGTWELYGASAEVFKDGEKINGTVSIVSSIDEMNKIETDYYVQIGGPDGFITTSDTVYIYNNQDKEIVYPYKWTYIYNHLLLVDCTHTKQEIIQSYIEKHYTLSDKQWEYVFSYLPSIYAEIVELTSDKLVLKKPTEFFQMNAVYGPFIPEMNRFYEDKSGLHAFSILEYKRIK